ncbi:hypothetical protein HD806DRAFT_372342 [Xylariaceae sp. AK1471]|nr:hypothetical protein HD806DRAFT_372342 [Xylariaceae sp. AK1471]
MASQLTIQIPPLQPLHLSLTQAADPRISFISTRTRDMSELQQKLNAVVERVVGETTSSNSNPNSESNPNEEGKPTGEDDDLCSEYGDDEEPKAAIASKSIGLSTESISSPSSYRDLASLNPYTLALDTQDLERRISILSPSSREEDKHKEDMARLAGQLDRAHAAIMAEEAAALRALRDQTRLDA